MKIHCDRDSSREIQYKKTIVDALWFISVKYKETVVDYEPFACILYHNSTFTRSMVDGTCIMWLMDCFFSSFDLQDLCWTRSRGLFNNTIIYNEAELN